MSAHSKSAPHPTLGCTRQSAGFTLLEMIGVLAIMSILSAVLVPNVLQTIENAALKVEAQNLANFNDQVGVYLKQRLALPAELTWNTDLATYSSIRAADILTNRKGINRIYVIDPVAPQQRVLIISKMTTRLTLPTTATIKANFQNIWNTPEHVVPAIFTGWQPEDAEYLVIERANFQPIFLSEVQSFSVLLNNNYVATTYRLTPASTGVAGPVTNVPLTPNPTTINNVRPKDRLDLYSNTGVLIYSYIFSTGNNVRTFEFDNIGTPTAPQPRWYAK